jgi:hypothetical protein
MNTIKMHYELCAIYDQNVTSEGTKYNGVEYSKMGKQIRMMHSKVNGHLQWVIILFKRGCQKFVEDGISQFHNFHVNFHKCHTLFSTRLPQLG